MKIPILIFFLILSLSRTAFTEETKPSLGTIYGKVDLIERTESRSRDVKFPHYSVIYFTGFESSAQTATIHVDQKNKKFDPMVIPVVKGQEVTFKNGDRTVHNVFSMSQAKQFDLGEVNKDGISKITFEKTGIVDLYCNIHPNMAGTILVLPNDRFARPTSSGDYEINGLKPGTYKVFAWHRRASPQFKMITIAGGDRQEVNWEVPLVNKIVPHLNKEGKEYKVNPDSAETY